MNWWKQLKGKVKLKEPLKNYTSFRIGGEAKFFIEPKDITDLKLLLKFKKRYKLPILVMGAGTNILVNDQGLKAIVLRLSSPYFKKFYFNKDYLYASSGVKLSRLINASLEKSLSGLEFLIGIPGTLGGALVMNAGIPGKNIADLVKEIEVMDYQGRIKMINKREANFGYRSSGLSKYIILGATIKLKKKNKKIIKEKIKNYLNWRRNTQETNIASAGCIFKNPKSISAGRLIDLCGLKGKRIGDAMISLKHANFILNLRRAKAKDVLALMRLIKKVVKYKFGIELEPEIKIWN